ncbi:hypothetical protein [Brevifollis gellanilyticus]|nr:hypothetical protein [Brevifollis gellanilyticus]
MSALYLLNTDQLRLVRKPGIIPQGELLEPIDGQGAVAKAFGTIDRVLQGDSGDNS